MSTTFPRTRKSRPGYNIDQVEDFLEEARRAYTADRGGLSVVTAESIRTTAFSMQKGGYSTVHVDAALERLEDAFAARERERAFAEVGDAAWYANARGAAQEILNRLARPKGQRFNRTGIFTDGYDPKAVDAFADRLVGYFQHGKPMSVDQVRTVVFKTKKRGYNELQVDLLLDAVIDVMLAVR
ncbi:DivIVA domain-containing protein [Schumannella luteola]